MAKEGQEEVCTPISQIKNVGTSKSGAKRLIISPSLNEHLNPFSAQTNVCLKYVPKCVFFRKTHVYCELYWIQCFLRNDQNDFCVTHQHCVNVIATTIFIDKHALRQHLQWV